MNIGEFNATAIRSEDANAVIWDVTPFGKRQGDAIDSYLHARLMQRRMIQGVTDQKRVVVLCDAAAEIPNSANTWLAELNSCGASTEIHNNQRTERQGKQHPTLPVPETSGEIG
jgi:hypothetical protein